MILIGIFNQNLLLIISGAFLASMTIASFLFLVPAFVGISFLNKPAENILNLKTWGKLLFVYIPPILLGFMLVMYIQYYQTGVWFKYFELQQEIWGRVFSWPTMPLGAYNLILLEWQTNYSLWIGILACSLGIIALVNSIGGLDNKIDL